MVANMKRRTRRALAGFCLAALSLPTGAAPFAAEGGNSPSPVDTEVRKASVAGDTAADASAALPDLGGAIYSPFSPAFGDLAAKPAVRAAPALQARGDGSLGLVVTTVTAFIAAGALGVLVRLIMAS